MANVREMHDKIRDIMRFMRVTYFLSVVFPRYVSAKVFNIEN